MFRKATSEGASCPASLQKIKDLLKRGTTPAAKEAHELQVGQHCVCGGKHRQQLLPSCQHRSVALQHMLLRYVPVTRTQLPCPKTRPA